MHSKTVNSLPVDRLLALSRLIALADDNVNVVQMKQLSVHGVENIEGKGGNVDFLLFPQYVQKAFLMLSKVGFVQ